jgi:calcineurin-like phosphoesterase family protein
MNYFTSDLHFGHKNILEYDNRPFYSVQEMDNSIIRCWNNMVTNDDTIFILGDVSWYNRDKTLEILKQLKGDLVLIRGNHDEIFKTNSPFPFQYITDYQEIYENGKLVVLSHFPIMYWKDQYKGSIHLYGHVHKTEDYNSLLKFKNKAKENGNPFKSYNVGCMMKYMDYIPRTLEDIERNCHD